MVFGHVPQKKYRLLHGDLGTEYDALMEALKFWQTRQQEIEDKIEDIQRQLRTAEGRPSDA